METFSYSLKLGILSGLFVYFMLYRFSHEDDQLKGVPKFFGIILGAFMFVASMAGMS